MNGTPVKTPLRLACLLLICSAGAICAGVSPNADAVRSYLQAHPEFLLEHEELAAAAMAQARAGGLREGMERRRQALAELARAGGGGSVPVRFRGHKRLIFFGFTQCPDVCPVTLAKIAEAMRLLGDNADHVQPLFISVDAERDTPGILADYVRHFNPAMIGLTGSAEQIARVQSAFDVTVEKNPAHKGVPAPGFRHSSWIHLVDDNGQYLERFPDHIAPAALAEAVMGWISAGTR